MRMLYWRKPGSSNFGDELNTMIWPNLLPDAFGRDDGNLFLGIGTLLHDTWKFPPGTRKFVFSTGVGYGRDIPQLDRSWTICCLRGPLSADALGVGRELAITDGGALVRRLFVPPSGTKRFKFGFMPHHGTVDLAGSAWQGVCARIGFRYIDPHAPVKQVLNAICETETVIAEAMHGAIVADALRVPWIPVISAPHILQFKWLDWCASLALPYQPHSLHPIQAARRTSDNAARRSGEEIVRAAEDSLRTVATAEPMLSRDSLLEDRIQRLEAEAKALETRLQITSAGAR